MSNWPNYSNEEIDAVVKVLNSGRVNYWTGKEGKLFEKEFSNFASVKHSIALSNGSLAIFLALKGIDIGKNDEVIVTSRSFIASASEVVNIGAKPVFVDVDLNTQNITAKTIKRFITNKTKAIICVHLAGWPCEMDEIITLAKENNIYVIEDCAQAHGAKYKNKSVGSFGDIGCWSFCQDKIISTGGEGGMVTTNNSELWKKMQSFKDHGKNFTLLETKKINTTFRWLHDSIGTNFRMTEIQATIGRLQLKKIPIWQNARYNNATRIFECASKYRALRVPEIPDYIKHAFYKCYIFVDQDLLLDSWSRDKIIYEFNRLGTPCFSGTCPEIYLEKSFQDLGYSPNYRFPNARKLGETSIMFLVDQTLETDYISKVCKNMDLIMSQASSDNGT